MLRINGKEVEAEALDMTDAVHVAFTGGLELTEVDELLGDGRISVEAGDATYECDEVTTLALIRAAEYDLWEGRRVVAVLKRSEEAK